MERNAKASESWVEGGLRLDMDMKILFEIGVVSL